MPISLFSDSMYEAFNHIIKIMWLLYLTPQKPEFFVFVCGRYHPFLWCKYEWFQRMNAQNFRKSDNIFLQTVICSGKQMSEIVRKRFIL